MEFSDVQILNVKKIIAKPQTSYKLDSSIIINVIPDEYKMKMYEIYMCCCQSVCISTHFSVSMWWS